MLHIRNRRRSWHRGAYPAGEAPDVRRVRVWLRASSASGYICSAQAIAYLFAPEGGTADAQQLGRFGQVIAAHAQRALDEGNLHTGALAAQAVLWRRGSHGERVA